MGCSNRRLQEEWRARKQLLHGLVSWVWEQMVAEDVEPLEAAGLERLPGA